MKHPCAESRRAPARAVERKAKTRAYHPSELGVQWFGGPPCSDRPSGSFELGLCRVPQAGAGQSPSSLAVRCCGKEPAGATLQQHGACNRGVVRAKNGNLRCEGTQSSTPSSTDFHLLSIFIPSHPDAQLWDRYRTCICVLTYRLQLAPISHRLCSRRMADVRPCMQTAALVNGMLRLTREPQNMDATAVQTCLARPGPNPMRVST
ncbi:hypothetical protein B0T24DRAFT_204047 [Lasiosphaeria ovina]|uniref:Uncharacterized protein n=1 Tax=Lasiosphaeria ovina TaxID=92902 RepID=A0AAE0KF56_9PEZI|nr:hypothetical protein B0T24DRAFT_204047 [Lasiosphaeria ovina]